MNILITKLCIIFEKSYLSKFPLLFKDYKMNFYFKSRSKRMSARYSPLILDPYTSFNRMVLICSTRDGG